MAEGFLQSNQGNDMETVGNNFFDLLVQNSLFQDVERDDYDKITHCKMHEHVHDLSCSVSEYNHNHIDNSGSDGIPQVPYLAINKVGDGTCAIPNEQVKHVRTLFFEGEVSDNIFLNLKCLRVLTLRGACIEDLPDSIGKLIHLRYLDISYTEINYLPDSIGNLYNLQTLRIMRDHKVWKLIKLPDTLKKLFSLRHLHIHGNTELPPDVGRLTSLQTLEYFVVGHKKGHRIEELGNLNNLRGTLEIRGLEEICDEEEAESAYLFRKTNISRLRFVWKESIEGETTDEQVLEGLQPHPSLKNLEIYGFNGRKFPLWTMRMAIHNEVDGQLQRLDKLVEIRLINCKRCEELPMLGHLPHLKAIELSSLTNVRRISPSFYGIDNCTSRSHEVGQEMITVFPALKSLQLSKMPNLTEWVEAQVRSGRLMVFPCLEELIVRNCHQLKSAPSHFPCLKLLKIERLESGLVLENICGGVINSIKDLTIKDVSGMINLPDGIFVKNQNILNLEVYSCPDLTHLVPHFGGYGASLKELKIHNCENLRALPDDLQSLQSLETLIMHNCPSLTSIPYPTGLSQGLTSLQRLFIQNCHGLCSLAGETLESSSSLEV